VLGILLAAVLALPSIYQAVIGPPCGERNLAACVSAVDGEVERMIGLPHGEPVSLETDVKEIVMYSGTGEKRREVLIESPIISLEAAGHPVSITSDTAVRVRLDAKEEGGRVSLALVVMKEGAVASRFDIQFAEGATIEKIDSGGIRIAAKVSGNAKPGMRTMHKGPKGSTGRQYYAIDQIFILLRRAIGSEVEAQEWVSHITRNARRINGSSSGHAPYSDGRSKGPIDKACNEFVEAKPAQAVAFEGNDFGWPLWGVTFMGSTDPGPHALLSHRDYLTCNDQEVWIVSYAIRRPDLQIRRYTHDGHLLRFVDTTVPAIKRGAREYEVIDPSSVHEDNGHLYFDRVIMTTKENISREKRRESYALDL
jgi:hypothetical protein